MKLLTVLAGLTICLSFVILPSEQSPVEEASPHPQSDRLIKQSEKSEKQLFCVATLDAKQVYCVQQKWVVNEFKSGKIELEEKRDTLWTQRIPLDRPCPGSSFELSMR
jgi:hypothetical protein